MTEDTTMPPQFFYRFRNTSALLGKHEELERQEIYFCPHDELNDPMEGYKDLVWRGDEIVWRNLLKHYLLCLTWSAVRTAFTGASIEVGFLKNFVVTTLDDAPAEVQAVYRQICEEFFSKQQINDIPRSLGSRTVPLRREELHFCLRAVHAIAVVGVLAKMRSQGFLPPIDASRPEQDMQARGVLDSLLRVLDTVNDRQDDMDPKMPPVVFGASAHINRQLDLIRYIELPDDLNRAWHPIFYAFPELYVDSLGSLVYSPWYTACFVTDPTHAAMWGHYGNEHRGVCLKFRGEDRGDGRPTLKLEGVVGLSSTGRIRGDVRLEFEKISYIDRLPKIDFFGSLGSVTEHDLETAWFSDDNGNISSRFQDIFGNTDKWRTDYWTSFRNLTCMKLSDWSYENEYRLTRTPAMDRYNEIGERKLKYRFEDLEGIIFGIRTPIDQKIQIIDIIRKKCAITGRKNFEFSQAVYAAHNGKIEIYPMDLLRFS